MYRPPYFILTFPSGSGISNEDGSSRDDIFFDAKRQTKKVDLKKVFAELIGLRIRTRALLVVIIHQIKMIDARLPQLKKVILKDLKIYYLFFFN